MSLKRNLCSPLTDIDSRSVVRFISVIHLMCYLSTLFLISPICGLAARYNIDLFNDDRLWLYWTCSGLLAGFFGLVGVQRDYKIFVLALASFDLYVTLHEVSFFCAVFYGAQNDNIIDDRNLAIPNAFCLMFHLLCLPDEIIYLLTEKRRERNGVAYSKSELNKVYVVRPPSSALSQHTPNTSSYPKVKYQSAIKETPPTYDAPPPYGAIGQQKW